MGSVADVASNFSSNSNSVLLGSESNDDSEIPERPKKRARMMPSENAFFRHVKIDKNSAEKIEDLVANFTENLPNLVRGNLSLLPFDSPILDCFLVLQVTNSRGVCTFMQQKRWRFLCREILPCGTRGACNYLTITDFLPEVSNLMPEEFNVRNDWTDFKSAPVIVISGFTKETDQFINPNWNSNLICGPDSMPRILLGTVSKPNVPLFVSDFDATLLPFAAMNNAHQSIQKVSNSSLKIDSTEYNRNVASLGYTSIAQLVAGYKKLNVLAVVKHFFQPKLVNYGRSLMQVMHIVDPSLDITQDEKLLCFFYATSPEKLPPVSKTGDIILIRNLHVVIHDDKRQGKGYQDSCKFAVVNDGGTDGRPGSTMEIPKSNENLINFLRKWFQEFAETIVTDFEAKWKLEKERTNIAPHVQITAPTVEVAPIIATVIQPVADLTVPGQTVLNPQIRSTEKIGADFENGEKKEKNVNQPAQIPLGNVQSEGESAKTHKDGKQQAQKTLTDRLFCRTV